ncbi:MAG: hypothetical protein J3K34DRAFT_422788 [Monoraphidium minutum]|nr:MAG: hypothetical protein J3K34DRAFT_422788 [Monoraphidium minutum]
MRSTEEPFMMEGGQRFMYSKDTPKEQMGLPVGHVRAFKVYEIPYNLTFNGKGPLLSAADADYDLAWRRAHQAYELCREHCETVRLTVSDYNQGGLLADFLGLQAFVPLSQVDRPAGQACDAKSMVGKQLDVAFIECDQRARALKFSQKAGQTFAALRGLKPGDLVLGSVKHVTPQLALVRLDDVKGPFVAKLHVSRFSCSFTRNLDKFLRVDERVMALVVDVAPDLSRVELSTAHLEVSPGDMQRDSRAVFATADRQAAVVRRQMAEAAAAAAAAAAEEQEQAWCDQPAAASVDY